MTGQVIAIDGPSGSGKSTLAQALAKHLSLAYLDTGAMYRAAALWVQNNHGLDSPKQITHLVKTMDLEMALDPANPVVVLNGRDVSNAIRAPLVSAMVSTVSTVGAVRQVLIERQQAIVATEQTAQGWAGGRGIVVEGRDITTVVAPDAPTRLLVTASPQVRLARRAAQLADEGQAQSAAATGDQVLRRDRADSAVASFQAPAPGVAVIDTTDLTASQALEKALELVRK